MDSLRIMWGVWGLFGIFGIAKWVSRDRRWPMRSTEQPSKDNLLPHLPPDSTYFFFAYPFLLSQARFLLIFLIVILFYRHTSWRYDKLNSADKKILKADSQTSATRSYIPPCLLLHHPTWQLSHAKITTRWKTNLLMWYPLGPAGNFVSGISKWRIKTSTKSCSVWVLSAIAAVSLFTMRQSLDSLNPSERAAITQMWSTFSTAPHGKRKIILEGILTMCCL